MYIENLKVKNFKWFKDLSVKFSVPNWTSWSWLNIFVWENNSWKTSIMEAMYFLRNKSNKNIKKLWTTDSDTFFVEQTFVWNLEENIENFIQDNKKQSFKDCLYEIDWNKSFTVKREFKDENDIKKILFLNNWSYINISWIDWVFQAFFQISNIWANTSPENESKFWSSTICWNLLSDISEKFKTDNEDYDAFLASFNNMFNDESSWLQSDLNTVAQETQGILNEQFWSATLKFKFNNPEPSILFKNIKILVNDWEETDIVEKWHWLQRAVILSLLQVYAKRITKVENGEGDIKIKPHFLFIDEPEMWLHPQAQKKLFDALKILSANHQIFISTHSENFISLETIPNIHKFQRNWDDIVIKSARNFDINIRENRTFFFHHHKLFFTKKAIFLEWVDDMDNYPIFSDLNWYSTLKNIFYFMWSCSSHHKFRELCIYFWIKPFFILDIDVISKNNNAKWWFTPGIKEKILNLAVECSKKDPYNLLDENLSDEKKGLKYEIIEELKTYNYFVLTKWAYEQYFTSIWEITDPFKKEEIILFLNTINIS